MGIDRHCRWVRHRLPLLIGGELKVDERRRVERHLIGCLDCRGRRENSTDAFSALRAFAEVSSPVTGDAPSLWPSLSDQIRQSRHASPRLSWWETPFPRGWAALSLAMGLVGVVAAPLALLSVRERAATSTVSAPLPVPLVEQQPKLVASPPSALPSGRSIPLDGSPKGLANPAFDPSSTASVPSLSFDLDHGTPMAPGNRDPQHSY